MMVNYCIKQEGELETAAEFAFGQNLSDRIKVRITEVEKGNPVSICPL